MLFKNAFFKNKCKEDPQKALLKAASMQQKTTPKHTSS